MGKQSATKRKGLSPAELTAKIRKLHAKRQPLNISAVRHNHPDLLDAAFTIRPFLGWRGALRAAGIDYADINVELNEYVVCQICGKEMRAVNTHALFMHGWTSSDYRQEFPDAEMVGEVSRAIRCRFATHEILPHWEPFWTQEYLLDRIYALHVEKGYPLTWTAMVTADSALCGAINLYRPIFGGWEDLVVHRLGLKPESDRSVSGVLPAQKGVRTTSSYPDETAVITGIRKRKRKRLELSVSAVRSGNTSDRALLLAAKRHFGGWLNAVKAAGLNTDVAITPNTRRYRDKSSVREAILNRVKKGLPVNGGAVLKGAKSDRRLCAAATKYFGSWDAALADAGLDPKKVRKCQDYSTKERLLAAIKERHLAGLPMNAKEMCQGAQKQNGLYSAARRQFGNWTNALKAAGCAFPEPNETLKTST